MCLTPPSPPAAAKVETQAPPAPPNRAPDFPVINPNAQNQRDLAATQSKGTSIFRNDLSIPSSSSVGTGINIPV